MSPSPVPRNVLVPALVAAIAALVAAALLLPGRGDVGSTDTPAKVSERSDAATDADDPLLTVVRRQAGDPLALGKVDAPVVMVNFSDFQCPYCGRFVRRTEPVLVERFVEDGILRIEWRDFPYLGEESTRAAEAARAAARQDRFWEFQKALYADQPKPNSGALSTARLTGIARTLGLDTDRFARDLRAEATAAAVQQDFAEGQSLGVTGTPAFLVNGQPVMGAQPTKVFVELVEQAAREAETGKAP